MIELTAGDLLKANAEALVNTVNCDGFMGRGIAAQFKRAFATNFASYQQACRRGEVQPGRMLIVETGSERNPRWIVNFPTKRHWRSGSRIEDIEAGLAALVKDVRRLGIRSIAIPPLGCGLGGLRWSDVRRRIEQAMLELPDVRVLLFEPAGAPAAEELVTSAKVPKMTPGRAVLVGLIDRYLGGLMDPFVSLLEVHKLMYLSQEAGEPLRLTYVKGHYGPYAENLRHVLREIEGHYVSGYADGGDDPTKQLELLPGALEAAAKILAEQPDTSARFERVADLVEGFETPFGMELLATVHWVVQHEGASSPEAAIAAVHGWNHRKLQFSSEQIAIAWTVLSNKGWLAASASG
ncbi:MAG TPA: macro domain-containing protein [Kofleriaceae bacterium]|nr:macro domain-containing protein [Kofleriaceae bacterium]